MEDIDSILKEFSQLDDNDLLGINDQYAKKVIRILCSEVVRLRSVERRNGPILRSAMMHMPIG